MPRRLVLGFCLLGYWLAASTRAEDSSPNFPYRDEGRGGMDHSAPPAPLAPPAPPAPAPPNDESFATTEVFTERYPNRQVKIQRQVVRDRNLNYLNHGSWTLFDREGRNIATGEYKFNKRHGKWSRVFNADQHTRAAQLVKHGFRGPFLSEANFRDGLAHGSWDVMDAEGRRAISWEFENNRLHGKVTQWFTNGRKMQELTYRHGVRHGPVLQWSSQGRVVQQTKYVDGRKLDPVTASHPNGKPRLKGSVLRPPTKCRTSFTWWGFVETKLDRVQGKAEKHGEWTEFYSNGDRRFVGMFEYDKPVGRHTRFFPNGQKEMEGSFVGGQLHGTWMFWYGSGQKQYERHYESGVPTQKWLHWDKRGHLVGMEEHNRIEKPRHEESYSVGEYDLEAAEGDVDLDKAIDKAIDKAMAPELLRKYRAKSLDLQQKPTRARNASGERAERATPKHAQAASSVGSACPTCDRHTKRLADHAMISGGSPRPAPAPPTARPSSRRTEPWATMPAAPTVPRRMATPHRAPVRMSRSVLTRASRRVVRSPASNER